MSKWCLTIGHGIGPEITAKFLHTLSVAVAEQFLILGDIQQLYQVSKDLNLSLYSGLNTKHIEGSPGQVAYEALEQAVSCIARGQANGLLTGPISKQALQAAGYPYSGHTEILDTLSKQYWPTWQTPAEMLFVYQQFRLLLLTRHLPLRDVPMALTQSKVEASLTTLVRFLQDRIHLPQPQIALMGLNPHAGELEGEEENNCLLPAVQAVNQQTGSRISSPLAADALFRGFRPEVPPYDAYVACYHDQGLIPFKLVAGFQAVNVTIGLPFLRVSVSHGTAPDIVNCGCADPSSLIAAYQFLLTSAG